MGDASGVVVGGWWVDDVSGVVVRTRLASLWVGDASPPLSEVVGDTSGVVVGDASVVEVVSG